MRTDTISGKPRYKTWFYDSKKLKIHEYLISLCRLPSLRNLFSHHQDNKFPNKWR